MTVDGSASALLLGEYVLPLQMEGLILIELYQENGLRIETLHLDALIV